MQIYDFIITLLISFCTLPSGFSIPVRDYNEGGIIANSKLGQVEGKLSHSRLKRPYYSFLGIPFAQPPVDELRFEPPRPPRPWKGIYDATFSREACVQVEIFVTGFLRGLEDCLYLNVFTPNVSNTANLSTLVYFHGGFFHAGSAIDNGADYFLDEDIVLVTVNYRLGVFGFLNTGDEVVRGNMGLKDQVAALKWVKENIEFFGGNPNKVTIFGDSAGGVSVHMHMLSPLSKGLFHKAISQSGTAVNFWSTFDQPAKQAERFAKKFNCSVENSTVMIQCLKMLSSYDIVQAHLELWDFYHTRISVFSPTIEAVKDNSSFLTEKPVEILKRGDFAKVPWIAGVNSAEGLIISSILVENQTKLNEASDNWNTWAAKKLHYPENLLKVPETLRQHYFGNLVTPINSTKYLENFTELIGDRYFYVGISQAAKLQAQYAPVYLYYNDYKGQFSFASIMVALESNQYSAPEFSAALALFRPWFIRSIVRHDNHTFRGACDADETILQFNRRYIPKTSHTYDKDFQMSVDFIKLWTSFASSEDGENLLFRNVTWKPTKPNEHKYLRIHKNPGIINDPFMEASKFWETLGI